MHFVIQLFIINVFLLSFFPVSSKQPLFPRYIHFSSLRDFWPCKKSSVFCVFFFNLHYTVDVFINENKCRLNMLMVLLKNDVT